MMVCWTVFSVQIYYAYIHCTFGKQLLVVGLVNISIEEKVIHNTLVFSKCWECTVIRMSKFIKIGYPLQKICKAFWCLWCMRRTVWSSFLQYSFMPVRFQIVTSDVLEKNHTILLQCSYQYTVITIHSICHDYHAQ